jgi:hypothetical protein
MRATVMMQFKGTAALLLFGALLLVLAGCSLGPRALRGNRMDYNMTVQRSNNEELLVNLVRAKYFEHPFFLQVGAIASQFNYTATAQISGQIFEKNLPTATNVLTSSLGAGIAETPTVTYAPVYGAENARKLLAEYSLEVFVLLARASVQMDILMRIMVKQIGDLEGSPLRRVEAPSGVESSYDRFLTLAALLRRLHDRGDLEFLLIKGEPGEVQSAAMLMRFRDLEEVEGAERLLGVKPERRRDGQGRIHLTVKLIPIRDLTVLQQRGEGEASVPIRLRNFIEILYFLALGVEVPEEDLVKGIARRYVSPEGKVSDLRPFTKDLLDVRSGSSLPAEAYAAVSYRGLWHFIADNDLRSKEVLSMVAALYDLQSREVQGLQPVLTLPVSR